MKQIYVDIEGTVIDSLFNPVFLDEQCDKIGEFISNECPDKVNFFTWGWLDRRDIDSSMVTVMFNRLNVPVELRGSVYTKEDSVDTMLNDGWIIDDDKDDAIHGTLTTEYGISKLACFENFCMDPPRRGDDSILIDDLVEPGADGNFVDLHPETIRLLNPGEL